jgi:hypothetical protein
MPPNTFFGKEALRLANAGGRGGFGVGEVDIADDVEAPDPLSVLLSPPIVTGSKAPSPLASSTTSPSPNPGLKPLTPSSLGSLLHKASTLILGVNATLGMPKVVEGQG